MLSDINFLAVAVSAVIYWILGGVWYAAVFTKSYQAALNFSEAEKARATKEFPKALAAHFVSGLISSLIIAMLVKGLGVSSLMGGMGYGLLLWLAFAFTTNLNYLMFERRPASLFYINNGFFLLAFVVIGGVLSAW
jgi:hypothetical protein